VSRELKIFAVAWTVIFIGLIGGVVYLIRNNNKYVSMYDVTVTTRSDRSGQGEVLVMRSKTRSITVQLKQCVNMENVGIGDHIKVIEVKDNNNVLQCIVRVDD